MKKFKHFTEELFNEGSESYPADDMTIKELKIACYAAQNILDRLESGSFVQRWQISAIVKAKEELTSVYASISAEDDEFEDEFEDVYHNIVNSKKNEETQLDEISIEKMQKVRERGAARVALSIGSTEKDPETGLKKYIPATPDELKTAEKGMKSFMAANRAIRKKAEQERLKKK